MNLRAYFFGNMYLSSIQQGIQAGHTIAEMFIKYQRLDRQLLLEWAETDKVMVLLNAGYSQEIKNLITFFSSAQHSYPFAHFIESEEALDSTITCVGIILPESIYEVSAKIRVGILDPLTIRESGIVSDYEVNTHTKINYEITKWEYDMIMRLNNYSLAK